MTIQFLANSSYFSIPQNSFTDDYFCDWKRESAETLIENDGSYVGFSDDTYPKLRKPGDNMMKFPVERTIHETLMTIKMVGKLLTDWPGQHGYTPCRLLSFPEAEGASKIDHMEFIDKYHLIRRMIEGFMSQTHKMLTKNGMCRSFKNSLVCKREFKKGKYAEYNFNSRIGAFGDIDQHPTPEQMITREKLYEEIGFEKPVIQRGYCPHPVTKWCLILVPEITTSVRECVDGLKDFDGEWNYDVPDGAFDKVEWAATYSKSRCLVIKLDLEALRQSNVAKHIFWLMPGDCKQRWSQWTKYCMEQEWKQTRLKQLGPCKCGASHNQERGPCMMAGCDCKAFFQEGKNNSCDTCHHDCKNHYIIHEVMDDLGIILEEPEFRVATEFHFEDGSENYMYIGGGYVYKSMSHWFRNKEF
jgi:hypothetical protein